MNTENKKWFDITVFYNSSCKTELLRYAFLPLLRKDLIRNEVELFHIFFSEVRGSSVRLHFKTKEGENRKIVEFVHHYLLKYLDRHPSYNKELKLPTDEFFLPFPNNCIRFNMSKYYLGLQLEVPKEHEIFFCKLRFELSKLVLYSVENEIAEFCKTGDTFLFAAKLQFLRIYLNYNDLEKTKLFFEALYESALIEFGQGRSDEDIDLYQVQIKSIISKDSDQLSEFFLKFISSRESDHLTDLGVREWLLLSRSYGLFHNTKNLRNPIPDDKSIFLQINSQLNIKRHFIFLSLIKQSVHKCMKPKSHT